MNIVCLLRDLVNAGAKVTFEEDWQGNSLTIVIEHPKLETHSHAGYSGCTEEDLHKQTSKILSSFLETISK